MTLIWGACFVLVKKTEKLPLRHEEKIFLVAVICIQPLVCPLHAGHDILLIIDLCDLLQAAAFVDDILQFLLGRPAAGTI